MISEKEMMMVDAVNYLEAKSATGSNVKTVWRSASSYYFAFGLFVSRDTIGTIEEYNQCIAEMSEGAFVPNAKPEFVHGQDVYLKEGTWKGKDLKFGCLNLNGDGAILLHECGYAFAKLDNVSSKPLKTKEEIELESAKKKQVDNYSFVYSHYFKNEAEAEEMFLYMQNRNELAEILLPLEPKQ